MPDDFSYGPWNTLLAVKDDLGLPDLTIERLVPFLTNRADSLPSASWVDVVDQAIVLFESLYPHLSFKEELFQNHLPAPDPLGQLADLRKAAAHSPPVMGELDFHLAMLRAFATVRDPHSSYVRPNFFRGAVAFLPFRIGYYDDTAGRHFIVTAVMNGLDSPTFVPGVELVGDFEGDTFESHVTRAAALTPGANDAAQLLRGLMRITLRPMATSGAAQWREPFDDESETFHYIPVGESEPRSISMPWGVARAHGLGADFPPSVTAAESVVVAPMLQSVGSPDMNASQLASGRLWDPHLSSNIAMPPPGEVSRFSEVFDFQTTRGISGRASVAWENLVSTVSTDKQFGYIRIKSFSRMASLVVSEDLPNEFARILRLIQPQAPDGLIVDIRSNPGGDILAAERMLQMLVARTITPAKFCLANTPTIQTILGAATTASDVQMFRPKLKDDGSLDGPLTDPAALTPTVRLPSQVYQGPVVLLVDALTYSAADIFAGGFVDHSVGILMGTDPSTGGGGASAWTYDDLVNKLNPLGLGLKPLPGPTMSLAFMRSLRVGPNDGVPIEDVGVPVPPQFMHPRTKNDLLQTPWNGVLSDLVLAACDTLAGMTVHRIQVSNSVLRADHVEMQVATVGLESLQFFLDSSSSPVMTMAVTDSTLMVSVPFHTNGVSPQLVIVQGFAGGILTALQRVSFIQAARRRD